MSLLLSLFSGSWHLLAGIGVVIMALAASWFGGKKTGRVEEKARAEVSETKNELSRISAVAKKQAENSEEAKNVQANNNALSDDAARNKLRESSWNSDK
ncbi:hypothetical protein [Erwinia sp. 9145]|uniref:hypothetical protein n=1 Tax=Erwinia sp. 9145 TaxID=1500895 RepID=UPI000551CDA5|nr:hypothetical protein [Erwinia sp. 9145]